MVHFEHIEYLWLLLLVAAAGALWGVMSWRERRRLEQWGDRSMFGRLIPDRSGWRPALKMGLTLGGISLLIVALANPQFGTRIEKGKRTGSDIAICLDVSNSMMAEDIQPNRLERSKKVVTNLLNTLTGDRVSLVVYAGTSFIQMPLTNDYSATKLFLDQVTKGVPSSSSATVRTTRTTPWAPPKRPPSRAFESAPSAWVCPKGRRYRCMTLADAPTTTSVTATAASS